MVEVNNNDCHKDEKELAQKSTDKLLDSNEINQVNRSENAENYFSSGKVSEKECAETAEQTSPSVDTEFASRSAFEMVVNRTEAKKPSVIVEKGKGDEKGCDSSVSDESLRDFAKKLGYNEDTITTGLSKLGPSADTNSLLSELVKAQSSVKQLEEGSSTFNYEKPVPVPEDSSYLRPIVIDGSNVAMRYVTFAKSSNCGCFAWLMHSSAITLLDWSFVVVNIRFIFRGITTSKTIEHFTLTTFLFAQI